MVKKNAEKRKLIQINSVIQILEKAYFVKDKKRENTATAKTKRLKNEDRARYPSSSNCKYEQATSYNFDSISTTSYR